MATSWLIRLLFAVSAAWTCESNLRLGKTANQKVLRDTAVTGATLKLQDPQNDDVGFLPDSIEAADLQKLDLHKVESGGAAPVPQTEQQKVESGGAAAAPKPEPKKVEQNAVTHSTTSTTATTQTKPAGTLTGTVSLNSFDNFVYINLASRPDRRSQIEGVLAGMHIDMKKVHRIEAMPTPGLGAKGCSFSHLKAIELATEKNWPNVVIFEDDFEFTATPEQVTKRLTDFFKAYPDDSWDVLMLVGNIVQVVNAKVAGVLVAKQVLAASAYIVNRPFYTKLRSVYLASYMELSNPECMQKKNVAWNKQQKCRPLDVLWMPAMQAAKWFVCKPGLGTQRKGWSNIENGVKDYSGALRFHQTSGSSSA